MSAYATPHSERSALLLHLDPRAPGARRDSQTINARTVGLDAVIEVLIDGVAQRLAAAVVARIASDREEPHDEWLDSREAAEYLGMHRDTLRRLAAARAIPAEQDGRGCKLHFRRPALDEWRRAGGAARGLSAVADAA